MPQINQLSTLDTLTAGDLLVLYSSNNSDARKATLAALTDYLETSLDLNDKKESFTTQYSSPNATAFNVTVNDGDTSDSANCWLILTPNATYADLTITLPPVASLVDKQEIVINCTQIVTTLTMALNGATDLLGEPTTLGANDYFKIKYDKPFKTWYRIG